MRWTPEIEDVGNQSVTVTITDEAGAQIEQNFTIQVVADVEAPLVTLLPGSIFVVDGQYQADLNSSVPFQVRATDNVGVTGLQLLVNNNPVKVDANGIADVTFDKLGTVELKALAYDAAGNIGSAITTVEIFDSSDVDAPTVSIDLGEIEDNIVTAPIEITGTVDDDNLAYYVLEIAPADGEGEFVELYRNETSVSNGVLATFDPSTLANNAYTLRIRAVDNGGNFATSEETVYVEGELKLGNFQLSFTDLTIPVSGIPVNLTRTYDTLTANSRDDFGYGWRLEFRDTNLRTSVGQDEQFEIFGLTSVGFREGDKVYITLPGGKRETFTFKPQLTQLGAVLAGLAGNAGQAAGGKDFGLYEPAFKSESDSNNKLTVPDFLLVREESGQFAGIAGGLYNPANAAYGGRYTLTTGEGIEYEIDGVTGDLLTATDTSDNKLTFSDGGILSDTGVEVRFGRDAQRRITSVIDPEGREITYEYDLNGDLIAVTDREDNTTRYGYSEDRAHYLDEIIDPLGRSGVRTEYGDDGRLSRVIDVNGEAVELSYDSDNSVQTTKDVFGNETTYVYDERGNVVQEVDPVGKVTKRTFDDDDNVLTETVITEETGEEEWTTTFTYDSSNNKLSETDALGNTTRYTYGKYNRVLTETDALGNTTNFEYDGRGNLLSETNAENETQKRIYDESGNITSLIDAEGKTTRFEYDSLDRVTRTIDAEGNETTYTYDSSGNQLTETKTFNTSEGLQTETITWTYDSENRVTSEARPFSNVIQYEYDSVGNRIASVEIREDGNRRTEYEYDNKGNLIKTTYHDGSVESSTYDEAGREIATTDVAGNTTHYVYDALGRVIEIIYPDNTPDNLDDNPRNKTEYDQAGRAIAITDERGSRTEYEYDALDRLTLVRDVQGNKTEYTYNAKGRKLTETDALNNTTEFVYDQIGRLVETTFADGTSFREEYNDVNRRVSETNAAGQTTFFIYDDLDRLIEVVHPDETPAIITDNPRIKTEYDELDRVTASIDELGNRTEYEYDAAGRQTLVSDAEGNETTYTYDDSGNLLTETDSNGHTTKYKYDELDRPIEIIFHDGTSTTTTYDQLGREIATTDQEGKTTQYEYDPLGKLTAVIDAAEQRTEYTYDLAGNLVQIKNANNNITRYEYDALNRRTATILPLGQRSTTVYDAVGNVTSLTNFNGETIEYEYDRLNRLTSKQFLDDTSIDYTYTLTGQIETVTDLQGTTSYDYDVRDRLIEQVNPDSQFIRYTYDAASNRTGVITSSDTVTYTYNPNNQLETVTSSLGETSYNYDAAGNLIQTLYPNNTAEIRTYDDLNRLTFLKNVTLDPDTGAESSVISSYDYTLDKVGNRLAVTEDDGRTVNYAYDNLYRLTQEEITDDGTVRTIDYTYDPIGNRLSQNDSELGLTTYAYNDNDWLLTEETNGAVTTYTYDDNGNTLSEVNSAINEQTVYTWDDENRLIGAEITTDADTTVTEYEYNVDGVRVASVVDGVETRYLVDSNLQYAQVLEEYTPEGNVEVAYVRGHDLISQVRDGEESFYHVDGLGSTRALTDGEGDVTDVYIYDAYGNVINSSGSTENNYFYTGEQYDQQLQDYYLRARYYDPNTGRFTARDPFEGFISDPLSLAKYPYVHSNPVNATDPTGLFLSLNSLSASSVMSGILNAITPVYPLVGAYAGQIAGTGAIAVTTTAGVIIALQVKLSVARSTLRAAAVSGDREPDVDIPVVFYGETYNSLSLYDTTRHIYNAITGGREVVLAAWDERPAGHGPNKWYKNKGNCKNKGNFKDKYRDRTGIDLVNSQIACDEYPFNLSEQGGRENWNEGKVSLELVHVEENVQGTLMDNVRLNNAGVERGHYRDKWFGVVPIPGLPVSFWRDKDGNITS